MNEQLLKQLKACNDLPSLPTVALEIVALCNSEDFGLDRMCKLLGKDPAIAAKVLKMANSSIFGARSPITTIQRAVTMLGANTVMTIALSFSLLAKKTVAKGDFDYAMFWKRALLSGVAARSLATRNKCDPEELFLAALFQDLGMLALVRADKQYAPLIKADQAHHSKLRTLERDTYGVDHAEVSAWLAENWKLPAIFVNLVRASHDPTSVKDVAPAAAACIALSGPIADTWFTDPSAAVERASGLARLWLEMPESTFSEVISEVTERMGDYASLFEMDLPDAATAQTILHQAKEALVNVSLRALQMAQRSEEAATILQKEKTEIEARAQRDALTGVYNRAYFDAAMGPAFENARRYRGPLSILFCDVDHFKNVNDTHGHAVGDRVLAAVARLLPSCVRGIDIVARYGGEEFVLILPATDHAGAPIVAERIRARVEALVVEDDTGKRVPVTISVGAASLDHAGEVESAEALVKLADRCLYAAKRNGRNRVVTFEQLGELEATAA